MNPTLPIICLMGPTASGKTDLAVELREQNSQLEIISVDSALVYRGMDIGTAKPSKELLAKAPHRLIDICEPNQPFSAGDFREAALMEIQTIHSQGKIPLLVGGTMLYFWVLERGLAKLPKADVNLRYEISQEAQTQGWPNLHVQLSKIDPIAASRIHPHDGQRIQRALEIYRLTGKPMSEWQQNDTVPLPFKIQHYILAPESREQLHQRIRQRLQHQFDRGFIDEVQSLRERGDLHADLPSMRTVGYRQVWQYLQGEYDLSTLHEKAYYATCQLAKRQLTWLRRWDKATLLANGIAQSLLRKGEF